MSGVFVSRVILALLCIGVLVPRVNSSAHADVKVDVKDDVVRVQGTDANSSEMLAALSSVVGFSVDWGATEELLTVSRVYYGPVDDVIRQLLTGQNYLIEHASGTALGVAAVTVYGHEKERANPAHVATTVRAVAKTDSATARGDVRPQPLSAALAAGTSAPAPTKAKSNRVPRLQASTPKS
jgi:hypothetical protein